jgi:hypothetical protein
MSLYDSELYSAYPDLYATTRERRAHALLAVSRDHPAGCSLTNRFTPSELEELRRVARRHVERFGGRCGSDVGSFLVRLDHLLGTPARL